MKKEWKKKATNKKERVKKNEWSKKGIKKEGRKETKKQEVQMLHIPGCGNYHVTNSFVPLKKFQVVHIWSVIYCVYEWIRA